MDKKAYIIPNTKRFVLNSEGELLNATLNGDMILKDEGGTDEPWNEGLGKKNFWDEGLGKKSLWDEGLGKKSLWDEEE